MTVEDDTQDLHRRQEHEKQFDKYNILLGQKLVHSRPSLKIS